MKFLFWLLGDKVIWFGFKTSQNYLNYFYMHPVVPVHKHLWISFAAALSTRSPWRFLYDKSEELCSTSSFEVSSMAFRRQMFSFHSTFSHLLPRWTDDRGLSQDLVHWTDSAWHSVICLLVWTVAPLVFDMLLNSGIELRDICRELLR